MISLQKKCIEPLGESKSDYDIFALLSKKLGLYDTFTEGGLTEIDWVKRMFDASDLPTQISWEDFAGKGYFVVPMPEDYQSTPALNWFAEDRKKDTPDPGPHPESQAEFGMGLQTTSGLIEFESSPGRTVFMLRLPIEPLAKRETLSTPDTGSHSRG